MIPVDRKRRRVVDIVRRHTAQNSSGDYSITDTVILDDIIVDIQNISSQIKDAEAGDKNENLFAIFLERYPRQMPVQGWIVKEKHRVYQYEIQKVFDYGDAVKLEAERIKDTSAGGAVPAGTPLIGVGG